MSSNRLLPLALLAAASPSAPIGCPASDGGVRLTNGIVYDGPVADNAILMGDRERRIGGAKVVSWQVDYVYAAGRQVYLSCRYAKRPPVVVPVSRPVRYCRYTTRGVRESLACR